MGIRFSPGPTRTVPLPRFLALVLLSFTLLVATTVGAQPETLRRNFWIPNGPVASMALSGNTLYIGGDFNRVGPVTGGGVPLDAAGALPSNFPIVNGPVEAAVPDGEGGWFVGGSFSSVGGVNRSNLAHIRADGTVSDWNPNPNQGVRALARQGEVLYAGGFFTMIGDQLRFGIAALDVASGLPTPWNPQANDWVGEIAIHGGKIFVAGGFTSIGGEARLRLAELDPVTGLSTSWNPNVQGPVYALLPTDSTVYVGGWFQLVGSEPRRNLAAVSVTTGLATSWDPRPDTEVLCLAMSGSIIYAGGWFSNVGGEPRRRLAAIDKDTGLPTPWDPNMGGGTANVVDLAVTDSLVYVAGSFTGVGSEIRNYLAAVDRSTGHAGAWNPNPSDRALCIALSGSSLFAGGEFSSLGGLRRDCAAAIDITTGIPTSWDPQPDGSVRALLVTESSVFAGGNFSNIGGQPRAYLADLDKTSGSATPWNSSVDGQVFSLARSGSTLYACGFFENIGGQPRYRLAALNTTTGLAMDWNPVVDRILYSLGVHDTTVYLGGWFQFVGGEFRYNVAAVHATSGALVNWNPMAYDPYSSDSWVQTMAMEPGRVWIGGRFSSAGSFGVSNLAGLDMTTGAASAFSSTPNGDVYAVELHGSTLYAGGRFFGVGAETRNNIAAFDLISGLTEWNPDASGDVLTIEAGGPAVYIGGYFRTVGGHPQSYFAAYADITTAVSVSLLDASVVDGAVHMRWRVPLGVTRTVIHRRSDSTGWVELGMVVPDASGTVQFHDSSVRSGMRYQYQIVALELDGSESSLQTWISVPEGTGAPRFLQFASARPNPMASRGEFRYGIPVGGKVRLVIYDLQGRHVATLVDQTQAAGWNAAVWNGKDAHGHSVASGVYFARLELSGEIRTQRIVIAR